MEDNLNILCVEENLQNKNKKFNLKQIKADFYTILKNSMVTARQSDQINLNWLWHNSKLF